MSIIIRSVVAIPLLVFLTLISWMGWVFLDPFIAEILAQSEDGPGFAEPALMAMSLGFRFVLPGMAVAIIGWWIFGAIHIDQRQHHRRY